MNIQIRQNVFETNSSSSHSLTLGQGNLVVPPLSREVAREGVLEVSLGEYGWGYEHFYDFASKVSYLITQVATILGVNYSLDEADARAKLEADSRMKRLRAVVLDFTGVELRVSEERGYIDHQSVGICNDVFDDVEALRRLLFDETSCITTDNDNH